MWLVRRQVTVVRSRMSQVKSGVRFTRALINPITRTLHQITDQMDQEEYLSPLQVQVRAEMVEAIVMAEMVEATVMAEMEVEVSIPF